MSTTQESCDVLVVGGGPTGLTLAIALRMYGVDTVVVDRGPGTKTEARASVLWQRALEALRDLECADGFTDFGLSMSRTEFRVRGRLVGRQETHTPDTAFPNPLSIEQNDIETLLNRRLGELGPDVRWSTEATAVRLADDGAHIDLRGPDGSAHTVAARWVVGCEGSHSIVRKAAGIGFDGTRRDNLQCLQLNADPGWEHPRDPRTTLFFINRGVTLIVDPLPSGGTRFAAFRPDPDPRLTAPPTVREMEDVVSRATGEMVRLTATEPPWANRARFQDRLATTLRHGRALLAGDSAHVWAPIGGRGLNTGLLGAHQLGWKLAAVHHGLATEALLDTYDTEQRHRALEVMRQMRRSILELPPGPATLALLALAMPPLMRSERVRRQGDMFLSDFARNHRTSALSVGGTPRRGPRPGDRIPNLMITTTSGPGRLHDLLGYRRWSLLVIGNTEAVSSLEALTDRYTTPITVTPIGMGREHRRTLPDDTLLLIRPDGHIGLRTRTTDRKALEAYLERWFVRDTTVTPTPTSTLTPAPKTPAPA